MQFKGFEKTTLIDFPGGRIAATIFTFGCNFRCPYCQNKELIFEDGTPFILEEDILRDLEKRKNWLDGVCITGGEPTIHNDLPIFIKKIKDIGLQVKLDTNGSNPNMLKDLIDKKLVDYVAMDIKHVWEKYKTAIGVDLDINNIIRSKNILMNSNIEYEFRTTIVRRLHTKEDIIKIAKNIKGANAYYLQQFRGIKTLDPSYNNEKGLTIEELKEIKSKIKNYFKKFEIRGGNLDI